MGWGILLLHAFKRDGCVTKSGIRAIMIFNLHMSGTDNKIFEENPTTKISNVFLSIFFSFFFFW